MLLYQHRFTKRNGELLQRIFFSLCFRAKPIITGEKSFPENKLSFGAAGNPLSVWALRRHPPHIFALFVALAVRHITL